MSLLRKSNSRQITLAVFLVLLVSLSAPSADRAAEPVCRTCHPKETARYLASPMGNSVAPPATIPGGSVTHRISSSVMNIEMRDGGMIHRLTERNLTAEYAVAYQVGSGIYGRSYLVRIGGSFVQSPASYFNRGGWDISPGFQDAQFLEFDRAVGDTCLFCHAGAKFHTGDRRSPNYPTLTAITCERCHGASEEHRRHPSATNIVNPAKLSFTERDSICEQCHLEGEARVLNPGRSWWDFRPGRDLAETLAVYVAQDAGVKAVSHVEQLAQSQCARASAGKLWCGTCHNPHGERAGRASQVRKVCTSCHASLSKVAHPRGQVECVSCHMPARAPIDIGHTAITDHRILRRNDATPLPSESKPARLGAWREPPLEFRERNLGIAYLEVASRRRLEQMAQTGIQILASLPAPQQNQDAEVLSRLGALLLDQDLMHGALDLLRRAAENQPASAENAVHFAIVLRRSGDFAQAVRQFNRAIELDPSLERAYLELSSLYQQHGQTRDAVETLDRYLKWNPESISARLAKRAVESPGK